MKAPNKIYIQPNAHDKWWDGNKPNDNFQEYIRKDALLKWLNGRIKEGYEANLMTNQITNLAYKDVIDKLNSM